MSISYWTKITDTAKKITWRSNIHPSITIEAQISKSGIWNCFLIFKGDNLLPLSAEYIGHNKKEAISILARMKRRYNDGNLHVIGDW